ncbi:MAG: alpha-galactosidase [Clostridia bacterium]|nr:alpha-galactosidase [Clostridia bacterium]
MRPCIRTSRYTLTLGGESALLTYRTPTASRDLIGPIFEVDGAPLLPVFSSVEKACEKKRNDAVTEYAFDLAYEAIPALTLRLLLRVADASPVVKFKYILLGDGAHKLTKTAGERLDYCALSVPSADSLTEVRFSEFNEMLHSFCMNEVPVKDTAFTHGFTAMGPLLAGTNGHDSYLLAYEHGSQYPDAFMEFRFTPDRAVTLSAKKGNYLAGTVPDQNGFETVWLDFGMVQGDTDTLAAAFREFQLKYNTLNRESRKPYVFYNSWCFQERNRFWNKRGYLMDMNQERMLSEIDAAHEMGIEVFVIDTGWYQKCGDWLVNLARFPDGMRTVKARLDSYGMKLGLWIGPPHAAVTSKALANRPDCKIEWNGKVYDPHPVWETEESYDMCLVSDYWEELADTLIRLSKEVGVSYLKWDAVGQYGCNSPHHHHGTAENTPEERADAYAFRVGIYMEKIVDRICATCPDVIVDFDITEGYRSVGLGFLSVGKYFLINNGPYYQSYGIPIDPDTFWCNVFVHPGAPRTWFARTPLTFDKWIPSVLFLTHYLPDDPIHSQDINLASLILGQNGIWGDLPGVSPEGRARFREILSRYKQVRDDITAEAAIKSGMTGSGFECYEKINSQTGKGVVCVFATVRQTFRYVTEKKTVEDVWSSIPAKVTHLADGTSQIEIDFQGEGACMVFFGTNDA